MQMLLEAGADARAMDINGCAPIQYLLKVTDVRAMAIPELCYQLLLNHNAARVYPPQFHKVQRYGLYSLTTLHVTNYMMMAGGPCRILVCHTVCCFVQVLQSCHDYPRAVEIMVNSYERLKPTRKWRPAIPDDCYEVVKRSDVHEQYDVWVQ